MKKLNDIYIGENIMKKTFTLLVGFCLLLTAYCLPSFAQGGFVADPMSIGVGARALGMGRAYVGMAEDADALFINPAGLARSGNAKLSTMYSSLMNDVSYSLIGGVYPYGEKSAIGVGIINAHTGEIPLTSTTGASSGTGQWGNSVMFISAGTYLNSLPAFKNLDRDVLVGGSFKYYSVNGSGANDVTDLADAAGSGYSADLGIIYPATEYLTLGLNYQNVLASKITRTSGMNESIPSNLKIGAKITLIGREGQSYTVHDTRRLYMNADYDINSDKLGSGSHLGLEFWPVANLALRAGLDGSNPTAGVGIRTGGFEFNYAYHPFNGINDNNTSFFSISYLGDDVKRQLKIVIDQPNDKSVIYEDHIKISGHVEVTEGNVSDTAAGPITVKVNGITVAVTPDKTFSVEIPVDRIGKKLLVLEASDSAGDYTTADVRLVRLINFADVPDGYWAKRPIEDTGTVGLVEGFPDGSFRPERALTRAELATLMVRAKGVKIPNTTARKVFKDVQTDFWAAKYIEVAQQEGLIKGYPDHSFRPNNKINKAEGIAILVRFENMRVASEVLEKPYWDVSTKHWAAKYIQAAKEAGMLKYVSRNYLSPKSSLARAEAVEMLSKTTTAGTEIKNLYSWEKGFQPGQQQERPGLRGELLKAEL
jgi:hypothetical protein